MTLREIEIAVVGGGPAGLHAALAARRLGAQVLLLDESRDLGGQYFRQPAGGGVLPDEQTRDGRALIDSVREAGVDVASSTSVWGFFPPMTLAVQGPEGPADVKTSRLIVASGGRDRCLAFPGWTLPGVMMPGALQRLLKSDGVIPGRRAVLAGSGAFLLVVARHLLDAGVEIVRYVECSRPSLPGLLDLARHPQSWSELQGPVSALIRRRVPLRLGSAVVEAHGEDGVRSVAIASLDAHGAPLRDSVEHVDTDLLAVGYGFSPNCELTSIAGCAHGFDDLQGGRFCRVDYDTGRTSVEHIYAAGEVTGIGGANLAIEEGRIAGLSAARSLGHWSRAGERTLRHARKRLRQARRYADFVNRSFAPPSGLAETIADDTILCRCEEVQALEVREAVKAGARTATAIKMWTRCGMGLCQGRMCGWSLGRYVGRLTGMPLAEIGINEPRIPIKPVSLHSILPQDRTE